MAFFGWTPVEPQPAQMGRPRRCARSEARWADVRHALGQSVALQPAIHLDIQASGRMIGLARRGTSSTLDISGTVRASLSITNAGLHLRLPTDGPRYSLFWCAARLSAWAARLDRLR
ncbi:hypothetical protein FRC08_008222 [Ceratobasidium sp. 394]|nr:hypothetical protein FRC08_008222 [Ceratobasidium sp. 394]